MGFFWFIALKASSRGWSRGLSFHSRVSGSAASFGNGGW